MDPELKRRLDEIHALTRDNHHLLRSVRRHQILETFGKWILWLIVIIATAYAYVIYVAPLVQKYQATTGQSGASSSVFQKLINSY